MICCTCPYDGQYHKVLVRFLNEKELAAREHPVLILIQCVVWISQYIHRLAVNSRLVLYVRERGLVAPF